MTLKPPADEDAARLKRLRRKFGDGPFKVPSIHDLELANTGGGLRVRTILETGHNVRRPMVGANCPMVRALRAMPDDTSLPDAEAVMMDPAYWMPHHSLEALADQFAPYETAKDNHRWQAAHVERLMTGDFARMRSHFERFLARRAGELQPTDLKALTGWMEANHPNAKGWFAQRAVLRALQGSVKQGR